MTTAEVELMTEGVEFACCGGEIAGAEVVHTAECIAEMLEAGDEAERNAELRDEYETLIYGVYDERKEY